MSHEMPGFDASEEKPSEEENREAEKKAYTEQRNKYIREALAQVIKKKSSYLRPGGVDFGTLTRFVQSELSLKNESSKQLIGPPGFGGASEAESNLGKEFSDEVINEQLSSLLEIPIPDYPGSYDIAWEDIKNLKERL